MSNFFTKVKLVELNFGPQHPAAHGVLRLVLHLDGEIINKVDVHIGLLHRGTEKLIEGKNYLQALPYFDRLDYVSMMVQEQAYSLAVENLLKCYVPLKAKIIRVLFAEITRILNHLLALTTHALDVGALTPFLWGFEEREKLMGFYEEVSGARFHTSYVRPGGVALDIPENLLYKINAFVEQFNFRIDEMEDMLTNNRVWQQRLINVGVVEKKDALDFAFSGVMLRASGVCWDLRVSASYDAYNLFDFSIPTAHNGDSYDRYTIRINEMRESLKIMRQALDLLVLDGVSNSSVQGLFMEHRSQFKAEMEDLITHFKYISEGVTAAKEETYSVVEAPKGEFGVYLVSNGTNRPQRCRIKAPGFLHLQALDFMTKGLLLADLVTIIGTQDLVFGEIDR